MANLALKRMLDKAGVVILASVKDRQAILPNETYAIATIERLRRRYGELVVGEALSLIVEAGHPGELCSDTIKAAVELVRLNPRWIDQRQKLVEALKITKLSALRREAKVLQIRNGLLVLLVQRLTLILGDGR